MKTDILLIFLTANFLWSVFQLQLQVSIAKQTTICPYESAMKPIIAARS